MRAWSTSSRTCWPGRAGDPIYVITLARPELLDRRPDVGRRPARLHVARPEPLTDAEMLELLGGLVPGLPDAAARAIVARAEGVPLYAVETVRMLINDGRLELAEGTLPPGRRPRPPRRARVAPCPDRGPPGRAGPERTQPAPGRLSASGSSSAPTHWRRSRDRGSDVERHLRHLAQRELIVLDTDPRSPERGQYRFVQGLIKEVAYGTLAKRDRRARHLAAARHFEALGDDELAGVLAQHYVEAYRAQPGGEEGAAVAAQARVALRGAAARASALASPAHALSYVELALEVTTEPADELGLRREAGGFALGRGQVRSIHPSPRARDRARDADGTTASPGAGPSGTSGMS